MLPAHSLIGPPGGWGLQKPPCGVPIDRSHPLAQGLVGKWALAEGGGKSLSDVSGNERTGYLSGCAWEPSSRGKSLAFNGSSDYVNLGTLGNFGSKLAKGLTVETWVSTTATALEDVIGTYAGSNTDALVLRFNQFISGGLVFLIFDHAGNRVVGRTYTAGGADLGGWNDGKFHHVVATLTMPNTVAIYVDGVPQNVNYYAQDPLSSFVNYTYPLVIGALNNVGTMANWFAGKVTGVSIYDRPLRRDEVRLLYGQPYGMFAAGQSVSAAAPRRPLVDGSLAAGPQLVGAAA